MIKKAVRKHEISKAEFETRVKKIIAAKYWVGLNHYQPVSTDNLTKDLNRPATVQLVQELSDATVTLLKGDAQSLKLYLPKKTAIISIGVNKPTVFQQELAKIYTNSKIFFVGKTTADSVLKPLLDTLKGYDQLYISINDTRLRPASKLDYSADVKSFVGNISGYKNTVICIFANAYTVAGLPGIENCGALMVGYQMTDALQRSAVKVITGRLKPTGRLPVTINSLFKTGSGVPVL